MTYTTYTAEQQKANRDKWVAALRSGEFAQTSGVLRIDNDDQVAMYCCLGVACELAAREGVIPPFRPPSNEPVYGVYGEGGEDEELPDPVKDWLGLSARAGALASLVSGQDNLIMLNDNGTAFTDIADLIESGRVLLAGEQS